mmetsp:Transcript_30826/g.56065  ORF Transcript_30826/g.56065 Transcript_30826/m.56065 type:complete len:268 (+) Transcript_30826:158-961(+)
MTLDGILGHASDNTSITSLAVKVVGLAAAFALTWMLMQKEPTSINEDEVGVTANTNIEPMISGSSTESHRIHGVASKVHDANSSCQEWISEPMSTTQTKKRGEVPREGFVDGSSNLPRRSCLRPAASMPNMSGSSNSSTPLGESSGVGVKRSGSKLRFCEDGPSMVRIGSRHDLSKDQISSLFYAKEDMSEFVRDELARRQQHGITSMSALATDDDATKGESELKEEQPRTLCEVREGTDGDAESTIDSQGAPEADEGGGDDGGLYF